MKKVLMGSVFAMILAAGITTSLAAPGGYRAADRDGICDYAAQSSGWAYTDEDNDGVCDYAGQGAGWRLWTRITMVSATMLDRAAAAMRTLMAMGFAIITAKADAAVVPAS